MTRKVDGECVVDLPRAPGRYEYKFVADGAWCCDPGRPDDGCQREDCLMNEHGTLNRILVVK